MLRRVYAQVTEPLFFLFVFVLFFTVQMQAMREEPPVDFKCKDKFLVQSVAITAEREHLSAQDLVMGVARANCGWMFNLFVLFQ